MKKCFFRRIKQCAWVCLALQLHTGHAQTEAPASLKQPPLMFTGEPMSMQFQHIELRTALQLVSEFSGVNIIMSDSVSGNLTMRLKDVPWDQVLHTILQTRGLGQRKEGNVIWSPPRQSCRRGKKGPWNRGRRLKCWSLCRPSRLRSITPKRPIYCHPC